MALLSIVIYVLSESKAGGAQEYIDLGVEAATALVSRPPNKGGGS